MSRDKVKLHRLKPEKFEPNAWTVVTIEYAEQNNLTILEDIGSGMVVVSINRTENNGGE